jgi:hypothetical protein
MARHGAVIEATAAHIPIHAGRSILYGEIWRERQNSARGWINSQNEGIVE